MRIEATIPDSRGDAVLALAEQLGLSRSQIVDEALALFLKAVLEVRQGRRLVSQVPGEAHAACELTTPTLTTLEWARTAHPLEQPEVIRTKDRIRASTRRMMDVHDETLRKLAK